MITIFSLVTSVKDYVEVVHKIIESDNKFQITDYSDLAPLITYFVITLKELILSFISFNWLKNIWDLPIIVPEISSAMISEISVLDGVLHNSFNFLDKPISYSESNLLISNLEKFSIGLINSLFLFIPTSAAHIITIRRFLMQGLEAGYLSGLGSIAGNILWIASILFGWRFIVIPWISLDIFRYLLGFILLIKYMWDSYNEKKTNLATPSQKQKIFLLNFLLALTEQTNIYPFISNLSIGSDSSILESFPVKNYFEFISIHSSYLVGLTLGCLTLLHFTCWFWENPAFKIYLWIISSPKYKRNSTFYYKIVNFIFLYLTMISAISSIPYYGLDYTLTNPVGFVHDDRTLDQKNLLETSFLSGKASDRNTRRNKGRHGRRERWKRRIRKYRTFDASLYDQGVYDLFTIEDLNYGFDRFWLRRKMRNHRVRSRFFPGGWMRSIKKQLAKPRLESYNGPRQEFFRFLFEQVYHPSFHQYDSKNNFFTNERTSTPQGGTTIETNKFSLNVNPVLEEKEEANIFSKKINGNQNFKLESTILRKYYRKAYKRIRSPEIVKNIGDFGDSDTSFSKKNIYSKRWKYLFSQFAHDNKNSYGRTNSKLKAVFQNTYESALKMPSNSKEPLLNKGSFDKSVSNQVSKKNSKLTFSRAEKQILKYRELLINTSNSVSLPSERSRGSFRIAVGEQGNHKASDFSTLLHPLKYYLGKQERFEKKLKNYTPTIFRKFGVENNAPYFRILMNRYFYYYKPTLRWEKTMKVAALRKSRRKVANNPKRIQPSNEFDSRNNSISTDSIVPVVNGLSLSPLGSSLSPSLFREKGYGTVGSPSLINETLSNRITRKTHNYTIVGKRASRYRYQIYKDVLQHWYYSPFNRLLLKFDIDLFINRQPNSHFLTKDEETLLHLRRLLLSEHYDTLRWYAYMQHYRSMKTKIGGTKSFASRTYNQQFAGTFKKIRHLFAITPSQGNEPILKFDQILYNDKLNSSVNNSQKNLIIHEELLYDKTLVPLSEQVRPDANKNLLNNSMKIIQDYLTNTNSIKKEYIKKLIQNKNYLELTNFLYKGQKLRGLKPVLTEKALLSQEKEYLLTSKEKDQLKKLEKLKIEKFLYPLQEDLWVSFLKNWKQKLNDQDFLKNYLQRRLDKTKKRNERKEKTLELKTKRLEGQLLSIGSSPSGNRNNADKDFVASSSVKGILYPLQGLDMRSPPVFSAPKNLSTGVEKAILDGVYQLKNEKINLMKNSERQDFKKELEWKLRKPFFNFNKLRVNNIHDSLILKKEKELNRSLKTFKKLLARRAESKRTTRLSKLSNSIKQRFLLSNYQNLKRSNKIIYHRTKKIFSMLQKFNLNFLKMNKLMKKDLLDKTSENRKYRSWKRAERAFTQQKIIRNDFELVKIPVKKKKKPTLVVAPAPDADENKSKSTETETDVLWTRKKRDQITFVLNERVNVEEIKQEAPKKKKTKTKRFERFRSSILNRVFGNKFKQEDTPMRRIQNGNGNKKNRGIIKKRTAIDSLKREFRNLRKYREKSEDKKQKVYLNLNSSLNSKESLNGLFSRNPLKSRSKQKKQRYWGQKRSRYASKSYEYKKRRRSVVSKIRILNKQLKKINASFELKQWWWKNFIPNLRATTNSLWQYEKDRQIQQKLSELSISEILEREKTRASAIRNEHIQKDSVVPRTELLQIGDYDYKPLSIPESLKMINSTPILVKNSFPEGPEKQRKVIPTTNLPFYAGWDESERRFIVTNRLLSRREAGYGMNFSSLSKNRETTALIENSTNSSTDKLFFEKAPLNGLNAGTTLYWQVPFSTYDPDQFFSLGLDGYAPIGWRRFQFRHSLLKSWLYEKNTIIKNSNNIIIKNKTNIINNKKPISSSSYNLNNKLLYKLNQKLNPILMSRIGQGMLNKGSGSSAFGGETAGEYSKIFYSPHIKNTYRRLKKRYERVKKHPISPASFPSGPLSVQVLPVHYIFIFYKNTRLPRDRYLKRRLQKYKLNSPGTNTSPIGKGMSDSKYLTRKQGQENINNEIQIPDFTLRKRVKTKRKYHLKPTLNFSKSLLIPRRMKFTRFLSNESVFSAENERANNSILRWRPLSRQKINKSVLELVKEQKALKYQERKKDENNTQSSNNRIKQLRRRVQRQILKSVWRYKPVSGGFVWPGDYLVLESVKVPDLRFGGIKEKLTNEDEIIKTKNKKKRIIPEAELQIKNYLLEKHNSNVIKKKLIKAQRKNKIQERVKQLNLIL